MVKFEEFIVNRPFINIINENLAKFKGLWELVVEKGAKNYINFDEKEFFFIIFVVQVVLAFVYDFFWFVQIL